MNTSQLKRFAKEARIKLLNQVGRKLEFVTTNESESFKDQYRSQLRSLNEKIDLDGKSQVIETVAYTWFNRLMALRFMDANGYTVPKVVTPQPGMTNPEILQNALGGHIEPDLNLDRQRFNELLDGRTTFADAHTEAYKMLLVAACNYWHTSMPFMFERISDYTELLLPDDLLSDYSIVADIRNGMSDEDCKQEELIGWLYQFYIADKKDEVFLGLKKNVKITPENIPAATQLFTPHWIVRYMVENTLGKLWLTFKPDSKLREFMPYYIESPEGNSPASLPEGINGITDITFIDPCQGSGHVLVYAFDLFTKIYEEEGYNTNEIPALILQHNLFGIDIDERAAQLAAFALTMKARSYYARFLRRPVLPQVIALENCHFTSNEVNRLIAKGLTPVFADIYDNNLTADTSEIFNYLKTVAKKEKEQLPDNAFELLKNQLREFTSERFVLNFLNNNEKDNPAFSTQQIFSEGKLANWVWGYSRYKRTALKEEIELYNQLDNIGSLFKPKAQVILLLEDMKAELDEADVFDNAFKHKLGSGLIQAGYFNQRYHCTVTNPPYAGNRGINDDLKLWLDAHYSEGSSDLFSAFIMRCRDFTSRGGYTGLITLHGWMFISTFAEFRKWLLDNCCFESLLHIGGNSFPSMNSQIARAVTFVLRSGNSNNHNSTICFDLDSVKNSHSVDKEEVFNRKLSNKEWIFKEFVKFREIQSYTFLYSISESLIDIFIQNQTVGEIAKPRQGLATSNNNKFLRRWFEVDFSNVSFNSLSRIDALESKKKWFPYNKGGNFRKWYGNNEFVINWFNDGEEIIALAKKLYGSPTRTIKNMQYYFKEGLTYGLIGNSSFCARKFDNGYLFDVGGSSIFSDKETESILLGLVNSFIGSYLLSKLNPTINFQVGDISNIPLVVPSSQLKDDIENLVNQNIQIARMEAKFFDENFEFDIQKYALGNYGNLQEYLKILVNNSISDIQNLSENEIKLNQLFSDIYLVNYDLIGGNPLTINLYGLWKSEQGKLIVDHSFIREQFLLNLISISVGCLFGRYNFDKPGLVLANQDETLQHFLNQIPNPTFLPDEDNIIPVLEGEWFHDDIIGRFKVFLKAAFGEDHFEENLRFIEDTLGKDIRKYFVRDFYNDHIKRYKKRPIYWMFSSPKGHFKALMYMHRYQPDLCSKLLNDYLQAFISKLEAQKQNQTMLSLREDISAREKTMALKEADKLEVMLKDCREYEKTLFSVATRKITIDLDDGVKLNYQKFKDVLVPIKGLEKEED